MKSEQLQQASPPEKLIHSDWLTEDWLAVIRAFPLLSLISLQTWGGVKW